MLTTHNVPYVQKCIRYIFKQQIRRLPGFSQPGKLKEESTSRIAKSFSGACNAESLVILNFGITRLIPNKIRIPKPSRESLQRKDFCIKTSG